ncbi:MAG: M20/M25/M40 family metallo-hydrolase, partial [Thermoanaerobaculia bacterium]|nr:M20/M25/M40 family metallo-hydrolase [Thermoanaerobaculia bacterium]
GADDNASGTAALLEVARRLMERQDRLRRDVYLVAFSGEERGLHGSTYFVQNPPKDLDLDAAVAMINFDMVGRLRGNHTGVLGGDSAAEWNDILPPLCDAAGIGCDLGGDGYGPSDQTPFYAAGLPVLHFFTGTHHDYHKPSDDAATINGTGGALIASVAADLATDLAQRTEPLTYQRVAAPPPAGGDVRSFGASLGTIPDYVGLPEGEKGVLLSGARLGGPADKAGIKGGDILIELAGKPIGDIYDFMFILRSAKPDQTVSMVVLRNGEPVEMEVTFGSSQR